MRLLIAYDGSKCSEAAIDDLTRAGFPDSGSALVISVAEVWLPPTTGDGANTNDENEVVFDTSTQAMIDNLYRKNEKAVAEAATLADQAKQRIQRLFPNWRVDALGTYGSPAWEILTQADEFKPDLIVVGSHGRSAVGRFVLGSISQKVMTEARCSVRIARGRIEVDLTPVRLVVGFDGSQGSQAAVETISNRSWSKDTEVRLIAATEEVSPSVIGRFFPPIVSAVEDINESEELWIRDLADKAQNRLQDAGLSASSHLVPGNPKNILVEEAASWNSDCIFMGANSFGNRLERFFLGSTSAAVAARAHCSVEVIRKGYK